MEKRIVPKILFIISTILFTSCSSVSLPTFTPSLTEVNTHHSPEKQTTLWRGNPHDIWETLQSISLARLQTMQHNMLDATQNAWIQLAIISKQNRMNTASLVKELFSWRTQNPSHPANALLPDNSTLQQLLSTPRPQHIAVLLPQQGKFSSSGQKVREGLLNGYYANLSKENKQTIQFYDTTPPKNPASVYQQAISQGADIVIGPLIKQQVEQLSQLTNFTTPILALNYTNLSNHSLSSQFYEFGLLPEDEAGQMAKRAKEAGLSQAIIIAPRTGWGSRLVSAFSAKWQAIGGQIQETWYYSSSSRFNEQIAHLLKVNVSADKKLMQNNNDKNVLAQQRRHDFDVIFLFAQPQQARLIVPLLKYYYANNIPIYATSAVYTGDPNPAKDVDLNSVIVCDIPWKIQTTNDQRDRLYAVGQDAYLLSQTLSRLRVLPYFPIYGATGALTLSPQQQIHRRLPCIAIRHGHI